LGAMTKRNVQKLGCVALTISMANPYPFPCDLHLSRGSPHSIVFVIEMVSARKRRDAYELISLLHCFTTLVKELAFSASEGSSGELKGRITERLDVDNLLSIDFDMLDIDWRAFTVLLNSVAAFHFITGSIGRVVISDRTLETETTPITFDNFLSRNGQFQYPQPNTFIPYPLIRKTPQSFRTSRRVLIEFSDPLPAELIDSILMVTDCWSKVVFGGYPINLQDLLNGEGIILDASGSLFDNTSIEVVTDYFGGSEAAWSSLLNSLLPVNKNFGKVKKVTLW
jgi:hypothetical protein